MLSLIIGAEEQFNEKKNEFIPPNPFELKLEHSLLSLSKWESIWKIPFLHTIDEITGKDKKTDEQIISYIKCMTLNKNVPDEVYDRITQIELDKIVSYINVDQTATWFSSEENTSSGKQIVTSELIYYWMVALQIPWEAQKWHLSRLYTLIQICNVKSNTKKKMSKTDIMARNRRLNEARKAKLNTRG